MTLTIRALGPLVIQADGMVLRKPKKACALLVYLAMQDGAPVSRERLADLLWPYQGSQHARHSLRNILLDVKKSCGWVIDADFPSCGLTASIDVQRFIALARSDDGQDLEAALTLYRGDLLEDFNVVSEPWMEWQTSEREGLREIAIHVAQRLSRLANARGDHDQAIRAGRRAVQLDRLNETSQRGLMQAYAGANRRGAAISQYKSFEKLMYDELGVRPEDETRELRNAYCKRTAPPLPLVRPSDSALKASALKAFDELGRIAAEFTLALDGHTKLLRPQVRESVVAMIKAADEGYALVRELDALNQPEPAQPIAA